MQQKIGNPPYAGGSNFAAGRAFPCVAKITVGSPCLTTFRKSRGGMPASRIDWPGLSSCAPFSVDVSSATGMMWTRCPAVLNIKTLSHCTVGRMFHGSSLLPNIGTDVKTHLALGARQCANFARH